MRIGLAVGAGGMGGSSLEPLLVVPEAERLGYDSVWVGEAYGADAVSALGWLAGRTERIRLGSSILQMPARTPAMTAMSAAGLDQLSGGRLLLGLGTSGPQVAEGWHGVAFDRPLGRSREYVAIVRAALARETVRFEGEHFRLPLPDGPGKALKLATRPVQDPVPIYLAAMGPKNTELVGEVADGWLPILFRPESSGYFTELLEKGAARSGRDAAQVAVTPMVSILVTEEGPQAVAAGRDAMRPFLALYVGGMGSRERNFYLNLVAEYGFEANARAVQDHYLAGRKQEAEALLSDELIDAVTVVGPPAAVRERLAAYAEAGVDTLVYTKPHGLSDDAHRDQLRLVAEAAQG
ncbi:LLM class F420-dependent oxidoreductase [Nocardioides zeae]|uniref:LLM class F420-dependent oxidoreductase n=1 Tax=Nocardioides imazamoxiresistens TaxID=3231893 RepID=A0ABU3PR06_9ACTN|nr:LLM class F420-dependent oxidoreductase [Nocardioides zeae]MDT9591663.1 LLM class F420-dependent oxidoreductase [Nocardioides zeae]